MRWRRLSTDVRVDSGSRQDERVDSNGDAARDLAGDSEGLERAIGLVVDPPPPSPLSTAGLPTSLPAGGIGPQGALECWPRSLCLLAMAGSLMLSRRHSYLLRGLENADSVSVAGHKFMFQPTESAFVMFIESSLQTH